MGGFPILIIHSASADASADKSAAKYSEMSAILGVLSNVWPNNLVFAPPLCVGWRVTFKVVDTLTVRPQMAGRPFQEQPHELYRK